MPVASTKLMSSSHQQHGWSAPAGGQRRSDAQRDSLASWLDETERRLGGGSAPSLKDVIDMLAATKDLDRREA
jgi:hypothetical protein